MKYYLAGPMSGYPQHNFPLFESAAAGLRGIGYDIVSPAEMESDEIRDYVMSDEDGSFTNIGAGDPLPNGLTWGILLARDVKLIADECGGIILLPGWEASRGARLEAFVAASCGHDLMYYNEGDPLSIERDVILHKIWKGEANANL